MYICNNCYALYVLVGCQLAWLEWDSPIPTRLADSQLKRTTRTNCCIYIYILLPHDDWHLGSPKHVEV
jgi:hypothetical protein